MKTHHLLWLCLFASLACQWLISKKKDDQCLTLYWPRSIVYVYPNKMEVQFEALDTTLKFNSSLELNNYMEWLAIREQGLDEALHHDKALITMTHVLPSIKKIPVQYWDGIKTTEIGYIMQVDSPAYHQYFLTETLQEDERKY